MATQWSNIHARSGAMPVTFLLATGLLMGGCGLPPGQAFEAMRTMFEPRGKNARAAWDNTMTWESSQTDENKEFQAGENLSPTPKTLYAAARMLAAQGRDAECKSMLKGILAEHPRMMPAYCDLAELQIRQRRIEEAVQTLSAGLRVAPRDALLLNNLGMCRMLKGEHQLALNAFTQAAGIEPHNARYRANMAVVLGMMGRYEESLALYRQIVPVEDARHNVAVLHRARDQLSPTSDHQNVRLDAAGPLSAASAKAQTNLSVEIPDVAIVSASPRTVESSSVDSADQPDKKNAVANR